MGRHLLILLVMVLLSGCGTQPPKPVELGAPGDVLVLATQGVDPAVDTVGFNDLVKNVTQGFSQELTFLLAEKNISYINVIDQRVGIDTDEKTALYALRHSAKMFVLLQIATETVGNDEQLLLRVQYAELRPSGKEGMAFETHSVFSKSYLLSSSLSGDSTKTTFDLAYDYMTYLNEQGKWQ